MAVLAALMGCQNRLVLPRALDVGITVAAVKEIVYQAVDYLGVGRLNAIACINKVVE